MPHAIEHAVSGRATCRGCNKKIKKGDWRLAERLPNLYADRGEMTLWYHLRCGAYKQPEVFLEAVQTLDADVPEHEELVGSAELGIQHRRLPRIHGLQRSPSGRARCRGCREPIPKDTWRVPLVFYDQGFFNPSGFMHLGCAKDYLGTTEIEARLTHFATDPLEPDELREIRETLG